MAEKIIILHQEVKAGAREDEKDTLTQAAFVAGTLRDLGFRTSALAVNLNLKRARRRLLALKPDVVFNLVESLDGRGEFIHFAAGLLESLRLPFTGSPPQALFLSSHKLLAKETMRRSGVPTPDWFAPAPKDGKTAPTMFPCIRKSIWEHASLGMEDDAVVRDKASFRSRSDDGDFFYEAFVDGREFNIALIELNGAPQVLPPVEISFVDYPPGKPRIIGYRAKWENGSFEYVNTPHRTEFPESDRPLLDRLQAIAVDCWRLFGLAGYARVDFRVDQTGNPWVLEINANPCLTPDAGFFKTAERAGFDRETIIRTILAGARARFPKEKKPS